MNKPKIYYKVVRWNLTSAVMNTDNDYIDPYLTNDFCINYKINEWVKPKIPGTKLMVFSNLDSAKQFANPYRSFRSLSDIIYCIYTCHIKNPSKIGFFTYIYDSPSGIRTKYYEYYKLIKNKKRRSSFKNNANIPNDTVFCSAVKLLDRIQ